MNQTTASRVFLLLSLMGFLFSIYIFDIGVAELSLILFGYFLYGCLGIVVTFHRYLTHNSFDANPNIIKLFLLFGTFAGTGSPLAWVAIHINHHLKSDKIGDPHSPHIKGYKIFNLDYENDVSKNTKWRMKHLIKDPFQQFLHRNYFYILISWSIVLYAIGGLWLVTFLHWAPSLLTAIMSNVVNYVGHQSTWWGSYRNYNLPDNSANNWLLAIPSWGETWHNNHHRFPKKSTSKENWWEIDISGLVINIIKR